MSKEIRTGDPSVEYRQNEAWHDYCSAINKFYWGMTEEEIRKDKKDIYRIFDLLRLFNEGGYPVDRNADITTGAFPYHETSSVSERLSALQATDPELAEVVDKAIDVQHAWFDPGDATARTYTEQILQVPFEPFNIVRYAWANDDAAAIRQTAYAAIDVYAQAEVEEFAEHFRFQKRNLGIFDNDPTEAKQRQVRELSKGILNRLQSTQIPANLDNVASFQRPDVDAAIALRNLESQVVGNTGIPRVARRMYIEDLAINLMFTESITNPPGNVTPRTRNRRITPPDELLDQGEKKIVLPLPLRA